MRSRRRRRCLPPRPFDTLPLLSLRIGPPTYRRGRLQRDRLAHRSSLPRLCARDRRHRCNAGRRDRRPIRRRAGRGRPVGAVVRPVQDARPDHREGGRRDRRQGDPREDQRGREPGGVADVPGAVDPRRLRGEGPEGRRRLHRGDARVRRSSSSSIGSSPPRRRPRSNGCWASATRRRSAPRSSSSRPTTRSSPRWPSCSRVDRGDEALDAAGEDPRDGRDPSDRGDRPHRRRGARRRGLAARATC